MGDCLQTQLQLQLDSVKCQHYLSAAGLPWSILNDDVSESKEEFRLTIEPEGIAQLVPSDETVIYIVDDDCEFFSLYCVYTYVCCALCAVVKIRIIMNADF